MGTQPFTPVFRFDVDTEETDYDQPARELFWAMSMSDAPSTQIVGVFQDRDALERAIEMLQSHGLERSQLSVLGTADSVRERLGLPVAPPSAAASAETSAPVGERI